MKRQLAENKNPRACKLTEYKLQRHEEHKQQSNVKHKEQRYGLGTDVKNAYEWTKRLGQTVRSEKHKENTTGHTGD